MEARARNHRDRLLDLKDAKEDHDAALVDLALATQSESVAAQLRANPKRIPSVVATVANSRAGDGMLGPLVRQESTARAIGPTPASSGSGPPAGNALRMHEDTAGRQYGLRAIPIAPHLSLTADPDHVAYQADARQELDLAVRVCVLAALATAVTAVLLADDRAWVLLALGPYAVAYLAYRGAVFSAHAYGTSVATVLDLNRFGLHERLRLPAPDDADQERTQNATPWPPSPAARRSSPTGTPRSPERTPPRRRARRRPRQNRSPRRRSGSWPTGYEAEPPVPDSALRAPACQGCAAGARAVPPPTASTSRPDARPRRGPNAGALRRAGDPGTGPTRTATCRRAGR